MRDLLFLFYGVISMILAVSLSNRLCIPLHTKGITGKAFSYVLLGLIITFFVIAYTTNPLEQTANHYGNNVKILNNSTKTYNFGWISLVFEDGVTSYIGIFNKLHPLDLHFR